MATGRMHVDEAEIDASLVGRLLAAQFPQWADFPVRAVPSTGTDNAIFRLGGEMCVRLPRVQAAAGQVEKEQQWLPRLAPLLPLAIPVPLAKGAPGEGYSWHWSVYEWLEGETATMERLADALTSAWEAALAAPVWPGPPAWIHGDLQSGNLLVVDGRLSGVIDFGGLGVGDPACDLQVAWNLFAGDSRQTFRAALAVDDAAWARGRGWALSVALIQLPYYKDTNPALAANARYTIGEVLGDFESIGGDCPLLRSAPRNATFRCERSDRGSGHGVSGQRTGGRLPRDGARVP